MGGVRRTGDVMRDARLPVRGEKMECMDGGSARVVLVCTLLEPGRLRN